MARYRPGWITQVALALLMSSLSRGACAADDENVFDTTRRSVRSTTEWLANGVDGLFGDRPFADGGSVTDGELNPRFLFRQFEKPEFGLRFDARVRLPNIEDHTYLFLGRDDPRAVITDSPGALTRAQQLLRDDAVDHAFFAGLGVRLLSDAAQLRVGLRNGWKPWVQARFVQGWQVAPSDGIDFRETVFWTHDDRFGSTTVLSWTHALSPRLAARAIAAATITQHVPVFARSSGLGLFQEFGEQRLLSLEALYSSTQPSGIAIPSYGAQAKWAQPVRGDWLIGECIVGHFWSPKEPAVNHRTAWALGLGLTMRF